MLVASNAVVGVDFGAPRRARDQRRKVIAIAAQAVADRRYRVDAIGMNERLLAKDPPGWRAKELLDEVPALAMNRNLFEQIKGLTQFNSVLGADRRQVAECKPVRTPSADTQDRQLVDTSKPTIN